MNHASLAIEHLTLETGRGRVLVDDVSLRLQSGEILALVGASGSGKSLTCAGAMDVLPPGVRRVRGHVTRDGQAVPSAGLRGRVAAVIMQNPRSAFNPVRTMRQHANETLRALAIPRTQWEARIGDAMAAAGLGDGRAVLPLHAFEMSGGMLQRMMIALALISGAPFIFADEPTTDLDLIVQAEILGLLDQLRRERGLGMLLVTHDMGVVARLADRVAVMDAGRVVETASVRDVFYRPAHAVTRQLVAAHLALYGEQEAA